MKNILLGALVAGIALSACDTYTSIDALPSEVPKNQTSTTAGVESSFSMILQDTWQLVAFEPNDGARVEVEEPENYTMTLNEDGTVHIKADCNLCNGVYNIKDNKITLGPQACTLAMCLPGSLFDPYTRALGAVETWSLDSEGNLLLHYGEGTMGFQRR
jgi:heat shock protein HslJ